KAIYQNKFLNNRYGMSVSYSSFKQDDPYLIRQDIGVNLSNLIYKEKPTPIKRSDGNINFYRFFNFGKSTIGTGLGGRYIGSFRSSDTLVNFNSSHFREEMRTYGPQLSLLGVLRINNFLSTKLVTNAYTTYGRYDYELASIRNFYPQKRTYSSKSKANFEGVEGDLSFSFHLNPSISFSLGAVWNHATLRILNYELIDHYSLNYNSKVPRLFPGRGKVDDLKSIYFGINAHF
ncbi:MAG: hypothetical protein AAF518_19075, partial [Spirochaetota bacterium]